MAGENADITEKNAADGKTSETTPADTQDNLSQPESSMDTESQNQAAMFSLQSYAAIPSSQTAIITSLSTPDSLSWPGSGTADDPKTFVNQSSITRNVFVAETVDNQATINGLTHHYQRPLNYGPNTFILKVVSRDSSTVTYYKITVERMKDAQQDYPNNRDFYAVAASTSSSSDGSISGFDPDRTYDYRKSGGSWIPVPENSTEVTGLEAGRYEIRYAETDQFQPSNNYAIVTIGIGGSYTLKADQKLLNLLSKVGGHDLQVPDSARYGAPVTISVILPTNDLIITKITCKQDTTSGWSTTTSPQGKCVITPSNNEYLYEFTFPMPYYDTLLTSIEYQSGKWHTLTLKDELKWDMNIDIKATDTTNVYSNYGITYYKDDAEVTVTITPVIKDGYTIDRVFASDTGSGSEIESSNGSVLKFNIKNSLTIGAEMTPIPANFTDLDKVRSLVPGDLAVLEDSSMQLIAKILAREDPVRRLTKAQQVVVDDYVLELETALSLMQYRPADLTGLNEQLQRIPADLGIYTPDTVQILNAAETAAQEPSTQNWDIRRQDEVDTLAETLKNAIDGLKKIPAATPAKPELLGKTDSTITVNALPGQEYSIDNGNTWIPDGIFTNLAPAADYQIITRVLETNTSGMSDASEPLTVTTEKSDVTAPAKPTLQKLTADSITVEAVNGQEYSIDGGKNWQDNGVFSGLNPASDYEVVTRVKETAASKASPASEALKITTDKVSVAAPAKPELQETTSDSITVKAVSGQEYSIDGGKNWQDTGVFSGLKPVTEYEIITRIKETSSSKSSPASEPLKAKTDKTSVAAPAKPELQEATSDSITVKAVKGQEYSIDGGKNWQDKGVFSGLKPAANYEIITRIKETDTSYASKNSEVLKVTTKEKSTVTKEKTDPKKPTDKKADEKKSTSAVKTGDTATTGFWILLITFSAGMIIFFGGMNRRKKNKRS